MSRVRPTSGVLLRRPTYDDVAGLCRVHSDPRVYALDPHLLHTDERYTLDWAQPFLDHWSEQGFGYWTVLVERSWWPQGPPGKVPRETAMVIAGAGGIQWHQLGPERVLNVYYRFAPETQGRGLAGHVVRSATAWAAANRPNVDLVVRTRPENAASLRVAHRAGFVEQGSDPGDPAMVVLRLRPGRESTAPPTR